MPYKFKEDRAAYDRRRKENILSIVRGAKNKPCLDCGVLYPYYVMQFDHVRGEKKFDIAKISGMRAISVEKTLEEISKCEVVCANCHAARTWIRKDFVTKRKVQK